MASTPRPRSTPQARRIDRRVLRTRQALRAQAGPSGSARTGDLPWLPGLLDHVHEQQQVFRALLGRRSGHFVQERFRALLVELVAGDLPKTSASGWPAQAAAHYLGGALFQLLVWWLSAARAHSPRQIEAMFKAWSASVGGLR